ncbi:hypothetical protein [Paraburkholderia phenoliruptrix]|uniref:hypothetical protein n=1 Tax=Paraburkholderia phenoliruptrix TaxID=252970 RepID=UPI0034CEBC1F
MPVAHFYNRSLYPHLQIPVPADLIALGDWIGARAKNTNEAYARFHLDHCENIARRSASIAYYELAIAHELADENFFRAAEVLSTLMTGYFGAVKSFLDAIAVCMDSTLGLKLKPLNLDLCRPPFFAQLAAKDPAAAARYSVYQAFYDEVKDWRNASQHQVAPLVMVAGTTEARLGLHTGETSRKDIDILLVNQPGRRPSSIGKSPETIKWVQPNAFFPRWRGFLDALLTDVCKDIISLCPPA